MSLIPFILELADELHEFNRCLATGGMDVDDFGFGIYPHELQPQQHSHQTQHPLPHQQQQQHQQQRRPRSLSQFYWLSNLSKSRHHPYYRSKPCCNKTPIHFVHDHHLEKESSTNAGSGVIGTSPTGGTFAGDKEPSANTHTVSSASSNNSSTNTAAGKSAYSVVNKNGFQVSMNVKQFAPNELTVKTIDNCIVVEGQHEDKEDGHGVISRHFIRKYMLPKGYDPNEVLSTLSSDGILTVKAPPPAIKTDESMERIVDIQQTGGPVQVQQTNVNISNSGKDEQVNTANAAAVTGTIPASVTVTLTQQQKQQSPQQLSATVESVQKKQQQQQQQQQPTKPSQPTTTSELQVTRERNGNLETNVLPLEQETESRTAGQKAASSNTNIANNITNNNNNNNNNNNSDTTSNEKSILNESTASKANSKMDVKETEISKEVEEKKIEAENVNTNNTPNTPNAEAASSIDNIIGAANADEEPMETEEDEILKEDIAKKTSTEDAVATTEKIEDATMTNLNDINSNANSSTASVNNSTATNNSITNKNDNISMVETNGLGTATSNDVDIEMTSTILAEANDIVVVTNNGIAETKTTITADGLTISLETAVTEIDGLTSMDAEVTDVADVADVVEGNGDGLVVDSIAIGVDIEQSGVDVTATDGGGSSASVEDVGNDENTSTNNLVVATESPSEADLVAAADAAIILAKNKCDVDDAGAGDITASKHSTITTEEITN